LSAEGSASLADAGARAVRQPRALYSDWRSFRSQAFRSDPVCDLLAGATAFNPTVPEQLRNQFWAVRQVRRTLPFTITQMLHELPFAMGECRLLFERPLELDADPVFLDPNDATAPDDPISLGHQVKGVWDIGGVWNI
jgi:hypothetical protein